MSARKYTPVTSAGALRFKALEDYLVAVTAAGPPDDEDLVAGDDEDLVAGTAATFHDVTDEQYWDALLADPRYSGWAA